LLPGPLSQIASELYLRYFIFDFATKYYWAHPDIKSPEQFKFTDQDYSDFRTFLLNRKFNYKTVTEESLNELITNAKKEKYYDIHKDLFNDLEKDIAHSLDQDLKMFRNEITDLLEDEIMSRYFYENGEIAYTIKNDEQVLKARDILNNKEEYNSILKGIEGSILVTRKNDQNNTKTDNQHFRKTMNPI
jgi:carboxyl-terminal processing protease